MPLVADRKVCAETPAAATSGILQSAPDAVLLDLKLTGGTGIDVLKAVHPARPGIVFIVLTKDAKWIDAITVSLGAAIVLLSIVVLTGYGSIATALESVRLGAIHYLTKPTDADRILSAFEHGLASRPRHLPTDTPSLARVEWEHLNRVLTDCDGNVSEAARQLGMHRRSLQRKLAKNPVRR